MRIDTPVLNTELVLEQPVRALDTGGGAEIVWAELGTLWAEIEAVSAREGLSGGRSASRVSHRVTVRSAPIGSPRRPNADCRFRSGSRIFAIQGVAEADTRQKYLTCWVEEGPFS